jgi:hypothetical protein
MAKNRFGFSSKKSLRFSFLENLFLTKRQRFVVSVILLTLGLFYSEHLLGKSGFFVVFFLSLASSLLFFTSVYADIKENKSLIVYALPLFYYTLAIGLFYFLIPPRVISRFVITSLYAFGLYSLCLSQNIFIVASLRTIPLMSGARIVSLAITLVSFFFLSTVAFSLRLPLIFVIMLLFAFTFIATFQSIAVTFEKSIKKSLLWVLALTTCILEVSVILWFWPTMPTLIALFLTGLFYTLIGLTHAWFDKRLFRNVMWEYIWVAAIVLFVLILLTPWRG